ncbi:hypothetical protein F511_10780 [Dorcoceras hygrometricum]|uniref:Uncharacterized protein n=1 Tax=Dorcoceras hygrometricum TaxID=472368 RepID=A0A2Z7A8C2_9LAMI|nr:hypothetical protein F511_10780 [Dorcoceras hygrometricum]
MLAKADILKSFLTSSSFVVCNTATGTHLNECTCWFLFNMCDIPSTDSFSSTTTDLALSQNVVVSNYSSDTVLLSLKCTCWLPLNNAPAGYHQVVHLLLATGLFLYDVASSLALLFTTADIFSFLLIDDVIVDVIYA